MKKVDKPRAGRGLHPADHYQQPDPVGQINLAGSTADHLAGRRAARMLHGFLAVRQGRQGQALISGTGTDSIALANGEPWRMLRLLLICTTSADLLYAALATRTERTLFCEKACFLPVADSGALILFEGAQNEAKLVS